MDTFIPISGIYFDLLGKTIAGPYRESRMGSHVGLLSVAMKALSGYPVIVHRQGSQTFLKAEANVETSLVY